ncbi:MAG: DMT family transporter [Thermoanaerobaculia bacterium]
MLDLRKIEGTFALFFVAIVWGSTFILVKEALSISPPFSFLFFRFFLSFLILLPLYFIYKNPLNLKILRDGILMGVCLFLAFAFQTFGLKYVEASITAFITGLYVIIAPLMSNFILKKKPSLLSIFGVFLSTIGLGLMTLKGGFHISKGQILVLICAILYSIHIIMTDYYTRIHSILNLTIIQLGVVGILSFPLTLIYHKTFFISQIKPIFYISLGITSIFATVLAFLVMMRYQKETNPTKACLIYATEIVAAALFSFIFAGEILSFKEYFGGFLIISAIFLARE